MTGGDRLIPASRLPSSASAGTDRRRSAGVPAAVDDPDDDPLWYDRVAPDEPPGLPLRVLASIALAVLAIAGLPRTVAAILKTGARRPER